MRILVINPNTTEAMTQLVVDGLRRHLPAQAQLLPMTAPAGDAVIATQAAFDAAAGTALQMLGAGIAGTGAAGYDAAVLACFGDPGLEALCRAAPFPVLGLASASLLQAEHLGLPYAVVTAGAAWEALLARRFHDWGARAQFKGVQVLQGTGLAVLQDPLGMLPSVAQAVQRARENGAAQVILGGAVFAGYKALMARHGLASGDVIDCVEATAWALERQAAANPP